MKKVYLKMTTLAVCSLLGLGVSYAIPQPAAENLPAVYVLKITSVHENRVVPLYGSFMTINKDQTNITDLYNHVTPYETVVTTKALSTMVMSDEDIKVEVLEKEGDKTLPVLSGSGHAVVSLVGGKDIRHVYAGG